MIYISHRGNITGPNLKRENSPEYIREAIDKGYDVEIDVWYVKGEFWLGHDSPTYKVDESFIVSSKIWCHAKNTDALDAMIKLGAHCFWHEKDKVTLTSKNFLWTYPGNKLHKGSICVLPESSKENTGIEQCSGICSDFIEDYKND